MVRAAKVYRQQQSGQNVGHQVEGNSLLDSFAGCISRGQPDEALRVATIAAELFFRAGDQVGESKALACVDKAVAAGANREAALTAGSIGADGSLQWGTGSLLSATSISQEANLGDALLMSKESVDKDVSSFADTDLSQLPISYGEMLVLKTALNCRGRPYDRQRQDFLAKPRRRAGSPETWGFRDSVSTTAHSGTAEGWSSSRGPGDPSQRQESKPLSSKETESLVARLTQPKRVKHHSRPPGEQIVMRSQETSREKGRLGFDMKAMVSRLASPRVARMSSPTPGERIVVSWSRSEHTRRPDPQRIKDLAKSTRRGGSARAWGILPPATSSSDRCSVPLERPMPQPPSSATCGSFGHGALAAPLQRAPVTAPLAPRPPAHPQQTFATAPPAPRRRPLQGDSSSEDLSPRADDTSWPSYPSPSQQDVKRRSSEEDFDLIEDLEDLQDVDLPGLPDLDSSQSLQMDEFAYDGYQDHRSWRSGIDRRA